jgi:predicted membrane chloride channel (bestrophin family)
VSSVSDEKCGSRMHRCLRYPFGSCLNLLKSCAHCARDHLRKQHEPRRILHVVSTKKFYRVKQHENITDAIHT